MTGLLGKAIWLLLWAALRCYAAAESCDSALSIRSAAEAENIRKRCSTIGGDLRVVIDSMEDINLDGIQTINGSLYIWGDDLESPPPSSPYKVSSSTLSTIGGDFILQDAKGLEAAMFPVLETVGFVQIHSLDLTHMDVENLHTVSRVSIDAPSLKKMRLNGLREVVRRGRLSLFMIQRAGLDSVDGLLKNPITGLDEVTIRSVPNLKHVNLGLASVGSVSFKGNGNLTITMGGPRTTSMEIGSLRMEGVKALARNPDLVSLTAKDVTLADNDNTGNGKHILLPFDDLQRLYISTYPHSEMERVELPPEAVKWKDFDLSVYSGSTRLDMSSQYMIDENGETKQTWYWPEGDIKSIQIIGNPKTDFFQTFLDHRTSLANNNTGTVERFKVWADDGSFDCGPFEELRDEGFFPDVFSCDGGTQVGGGVTFSLPRALLATLVGLVCMV